MKKIALIITCLTMTSSFAASDYFPLWQGNTWEYAYTESFYRIIPNPSTTVDSGIVIWEVVEPVYLEGKTPAELRIKQTRKLLRRKVSGGSLPGYDSIFSSPVVSIDTVRFQADSIINAVSFVGATCPVAVHDPEGFLPSELIVKDTVVPLLQSGADRQGVKVSSLECSCRGSWLYTFVLAPDIGPAEIIISMCPTLTLVGASKRETRRLVSWSFPTAVRDLNQREAPLPVVTIKKSARSIECSFANSVRPVSVEMFSVSGKSVVRFVNTTSGTATGNIGLVPPGYYVMKIQSTGGSMTKGIWIGRYY